MGILNSEFGKLQMKEKLNSCRTKKYSFVGEGEAEVAVNDALGLRKK